MQPKSKIQYRLKQLVFRHLQKELRANFKKSAATCRHNEPCALGGTGAWIGRCGLFQIDGKPRGTLCDPRVDQDAVAKNCPYWESRSSKAEIRSEYEAVVKNPDLGVVASEYPDIAALRWVLSGAAEETVVGEAEDLPSSEDIAKVDEGPPEEPDAVWWRRGVLGRVFGSPSHD